MTEPTPPSALEKDDSNMPSAFGHSESLNSVMEKYGSDNHALKAEGLFRMILFSRTNSFVASDETEFRLLVDDFAKFLSTEAARKNELTEKYGETIPHEIEQAKIIGMMESSDIGIEYFARIQQAGIDTGPTYKELIANIKNSDMSDEARDSLLADVETAYTEGQQQAQALVGILTSLEKMAPDTNNNDRDASLSHKFDNQKPSDGIEFDKVRTDMGIGKAEEIASVENDAKPTDPALNNMA